MDFLSKTCHYNGGLLYVHPNYLKLLQTKEFYTGSNHSIHANPYEYLDSKLKQYSAASGELSGLLQIARDFH